MSKTQKCDVALEDVSDEQLLERIQKGETDLFGPLLRRYEKELFGYLRRYLGDETLAEDVFQNTFLKLFEKIDQYEAGRPARPWIYTMATHLAIDALRRSGRRASVSLDQALSQDGNTSTAGIDLLANRELDPFAKLATKERQQLVRQGIDKLPEHLKLTLILAYYQGMKYRDIAEVMKVPVGTVKSRLHLALARLHELWQKSSALMETPRP